MKVFVTCVMAVSILTLQLATGKFAADSIQNVFTIVLNTLHESPLYDRREVIQRCVVD